MEFREGGRFADFGILYVGLGVCAYSGFSGLGTYMVARVGLFSWRGCFSLHIFTEMGGNFRIFGFLGSEGGLGV